MNVHASLIDLGLALAAGLLVGLEREQSRDPDGKGGSFLGGVRTYPLFALLGALSVLVGAATTVWIPVAALLGLAAFLAVSFAADVRAGSDRGLTSESAALVTFMLGALAASDRVIPAPSERGVVVGATAVVVTFLLSSKPRLHGLVQRVSPDDLYATIKFLIVAVVILPLLPNRPLGPLQVINPFNVGLMVVLIAGLSFVGYVAQRMLGAGKGLVLTALLGGLVSSTAVTLAFANRARREGSLAPMAAVAIVLASVVMFGRVLVEVAVVHPPLLRSVAAPLAAMAAGGVIAAVVMRRRTSAEEKPFELGAAVKMAVLFAGVLLVSKAAQTWAGSRGLYLAAVLGGTTDVDAITLSTANLARDGLEPRVATATILLGVATNTAVKAGIAAVVGGARLGRIVAVTSVVMLAAGGAALAVTWR
jgi:uncharacterized membrane protein (DUF4010 family)